MNRTVILIITILAVVPLIKSEIPEHDHSTMMMGQSDNNNQDGELLGVGKNSFWLKEQNFTLWFHIIIMMMSLGTLIPIGIVLGLANVKSRWYINVQIVGILISVIGFFFGNPSKSLYPMNFHSKFGWIILFVLLLQAVFGFIRFTFDERNHKFRFVKLNIDDSRDENYSASSHEVKSSVHDSLLYNSNDSSQTEYEREDFPSPRQNNFSSKIRSIASKKIFKIIHNIIGYTLIILIYSQFILGFITLSDTCHGESFGNCLAHYSKGSIFLWFGLVAFARYLGFFEKFGWEWNVLPISSSDDFNNEKNQKGKVSFSFLESVIVFLYGITNTFLEHTGKDPWNHRDIQHATLAFMWWWAGLLGIILESKRIRKILFSNSSTSIENPIPSIIFIVTAISISTHHQTNEFSLTIHKQFGGFLLLAGLFRLITIMVLHNNNNVISNTNYNSNDLKNSIIHPPTEFIASFCFVACGITLMIANKSIIFLFSNIYNFDTNFILNFVIASSFFTLSFVTFLLFIYKYSLPYKK